MTEITIPPEALKAATRALCLANGIDPDTEVVPPGMPYGTPMVKQWTLMAPRVELGLKAGLRAWPDSILMPVELILPLPQQEKQDG